MLSGSQGAREPLLSLARYPDETPLRHLQCPAGFEANPAHKPLRIINQMRHRVNFLVSESADKERIMKIISTLEAFDVVVFTASLI